MRHRKTWATVPGMLSLVSAVRDLGRLREITIVLVRHGFGEIVSRLGLFRPRRLVERSGEDADAVLGEDSPDIAHEAARGEEERQRVSIHERLRLVLQDLGPSFIKLGQIASTRADILPLALIAELKKLQDDVPPVPFEAIKAQIETSLGAPLGELYVSFDEKALATASIGQVHRAVIRTAEGDRNVVVKVQRPGVGVTVARDVALLHTLAAALERAIPESKTYSPVGLVQQFDRSITAELNFVIEADNAERFAKNFAGHPVVRFPKVYRDASSTHVLTLEFFDGKKLNAAIAAGASGPYLARKAVGIVIKMAFEDGFFHADPHPGNIIILGSPEQPVIGLIDLGMVGRLSPEMRERALDLMVAVVRKDSYAVADALYELGRPTRKVDMTEYRNEVALLAEKYIGRTVKEIELAAMIRDLVDGALKYGIEIRAEFMLVAKALMTIEGIGKEIDPNLDVFGESAPFFLELLKRRYSPLRLGHELWRSFEQLSRASHDMPMHLREVLDDLRLGRLTVRTIDPFLPAVADRLGRRLFSALIVATLLASGTLLLDRDKYVVLGIIMLCLAVVGWSIHMALDMWRAMKKSRK